MSATQIFVPRLMDSANLNAQNNNARMLIKRWALLNLRLTTLTYGEPDTDVVSRENVEMVRLWRRHGWCLHLFLRYFWRYNLIVYPGGHLSDVAGLRWRTRLGYRAPVIATLEGLVGDEERERFYSNAAGHSVFCQRVDVGSLRRADGVLEQADHIIAISPFLTRLGQTRYGNKFSTLPLGIDTAIFFPRVGDRCSRGELVVVSAGRVAAHKRPELFLSLAAENPRVRFRWFGEGDQRSLLIKQAADTGLSNVEFPGALPPEKLAQEFRNADVFLLPSRSEGVPKVTQEAAACGLPLIVFGFYETPTVVNGQNGYVVWSDEELRDRLADLLDCEQSRRSMGQHSELMAMEWDWDVIAPKWENLVLSFAR